MDMLRAPPNGYSYPSAKPRHATPKAKPGQNQAKPSPVKTFTASLPNRRKAQHEPSTHQGSTATITTKK